MSIFVILRSFNLYLGASFADLMNRHKARTPSSLSLCQFIKNRKTSTATTLIAICCTNLLRNKTQNKNLKNYPTLADGIRGRVKSPKLLTKNFFGNLT